MNNDKAYSRQNKVLLIYTGGTIGMGRNPMTGALEPLNFEHLIENLPEFAYLKTDIDTYQFTPPIDSSDMSLRRWAQLVRIIADNYNQYDGFVILHGTDTMAYTASALSFMLENLTKPVILTGSQLPIGQLRTDGKENLVTSIELASIHNEEGHAMVPEVCIYFNGRLLRGNRCTKQNADGFDAFNSFNYPHLCDAGVEFSFNKHYILKRDFTKPMIPHFAMDPNVVVFSLFPGIQQNIVRHVLEAPELRGIVLRSFGSGNAPQKPWLQQLLKEATRRGVTVVNCDRIRLDSRERRGKTDVPARTLYRQQCDKNSHEPQPMRRDNKITKKIEMPTINPFARPVYLMAKPAGSLCNLRCKYCYYLEKGKLYDNNEKHIMSDQLLEKFIKDYIEAQTMPEVMFTWHGGETLMRPISFYKKALRLQQQYAGGRRIDNCIQTNATMLTEEWCKFFHDNNFLVGVSIDGPQEFHDAYRKTATGRPTWNQVMRGIRMLNKYNVEWNALAVVNNLNVEHPLEFYHFFKDINCHFIQFTPIVERIVDDRADGLQLAPGMTEGGKMADFSVTAEQWGTFLCTIFDEWVRHDVGEYFIQLFDSALANWVGVAPGLCTMAAECGHAGVMEYNGDVYSCDHFVYPEHLLGNLRENTVTQMMYSPKQREFARMKKELLPKQCKECDVLFACHGECPKNRFINDRYGNPGLNYLCAGYHKFFKHITPYMEFMKGELAAKRPPANVMNYIVSE